MKYNYIHVLPQVSLHKLHISCLYWTVIVRVKTKKCKVVLISCITYERTTMEVKKSILKILYYCCYNIFVFIRKWNYACHLVNLVMLIVTKAKNLVCAISRKEPFRKCLPLLVILYLKGAAETSNWSKWTSASKAIEDGFS